MHIRALLAAGRPLFSFEFFPPKTPEGKDALYRTIEELRPLQPNFVSMTYGAGGGTQQLTVELVATIKNLGLEPMAHITCVGHSQDELRAILDSLAERQIDNVLALRG